MLVIALTGSIASGKSTTVSWLNELGFHVDDADANVHKMFQSNTTVINQIQHLWPDCVDQNGVNRVCLRQKVINDPSALKQLESITHPVARQMSLDFLEQRKAAGDKIVFLDIPLLFESQGPRRYDASLVVYCSPENQRARYLARGSDPAAFDYLVAKQVPVETKLEKADFTLNTDGTLAQTRQKLIEVLHQMEKTYNIKLLDH